MKFDKKAKYLNFKNVTDATAKTAWWLYNTD